LLYICNGCNGTQAVWASAGAVQICLVGREGRLDLADVKISRMSSSPLAGSVVLRVSPRGASRLLHLLVGGHTGNVCRWSHTRGCSDRDQEISDGWQLFLQPVLANWWCLNSCLHVRYNVRHVRSKAQKRNNSCSRRGFSAAARDAVQACPSALTVSLFAEITYFSLAARGSRRVPVLNAWVGLPCGPDPYWTALCVLRWCRGRARTILLVHRHSSCIWSSTHISSRYGWSG
jgi:hypothetical protein